MAQHKYNGSGCSRSSSVVVLLLLLSLFLLSLEGVGAQSAAQQSLLKTGITAMKCDKPKNCYLLEFNNNYPTPITVKGVANCDGTSNMTQTITLGIFEKKFVPFCPIDGTPIGYRICQFVASGTSPNTGEEVQYSNFQDACDPIDLNNYQSKVCGNGGGDVDDDDDGISRCGGDPFCHLANGTGDHNCFLMLIIFVPEAIVCVLIYSICFKAPQDTVEENVVRKASQNTGLYEQMMSALNSKTTENKAKKQLLASVQNALGVGDVDGEGFSTIGGVSGGSSSSSLPTPQTTPGGAPMASVSQGSSHASSSIAGKDILTGVNVVPNNDPMGVVADGMNVTQPLQPTSVNVHHFHHGSNKLIRKRNKTSESMSSSTYNNNTDIPPPPPSTTTTTTTTASKKSKTSTTTKSSKSNKKTSSTPLTAPPPPPPPVEESVYGEEEDEGRSVADTDAISVVSSEETSLFSYDPTDAISVNQTDEDIRRENSFNNALLSPTPVFYLPIQQ